MSFKSGVEGRGSDRWWERRWWQWWGDMHRMRWTRRTVNRMRLTDMCWDIGVEIKLNQSNLKLASLFHTPTVVGGIIIDTTRSQPVHINWCGDWDTPADTHLLRSVFDQCVPSIEAAAASLHCSTRIQKPGQDTGPEHKFDPRPTEWPLNQFCQSCSVLLHPASVSYGWPRLAFHNGV